MRIIFVWEKEKNNYVPRNFYEFQVSNRRDGRIKYIIQRKWIENKCKKWVSFHVNTSKDSCFLVKKKRKKTECFWNIKNNNLLLFITGSCYSSPPPPLLLQVLVFFCIESKLLICSSTLIKLRLVFTCNIIVFFFTLNSSLLKRQTHIRLQSYFWIYNHNLK